MAGRLVDRRAVVTGGAAGIGRAIAAAFVREGAAVMVADIDGAAAEQTANELASEFADATVCSVGCDVTSLADTEALAEQAVAQLCSINVLVNNAGLSGRRLITEIDEELIDRLLAVNLKGVILCAKAFAQPMIEAGDAVMINMSSQAGKRGWSELSVYGATKAGVLGMNRALAVELAPRVRVNAICPGYISDVGMAWRGWQQRAGDSGGDAASIGADFAVQNIPLQRLQSADDIANSAVFLASSEAREITGAAINVGGGVAMD